MSQPTQSPYLVESTVAQVTRARLPNGLRVWSQPRPGSGTVALVMQIPVGSRHESEANNGISHFLEHMLFTGTERWSEEEVMEVIRRRGGQANAYTGVEETDIYVHLNAEHLALALEWLGQVVFHPTLAPDKVDKERRVIINEKGGEFGRLRRLYEWIEDRRLGWNVGRAARHRLFPESPLLLPVIGVDGSLQGLDHTALLAHYRRHYVPNNLTLIAVGDFEPDEFRAQVEAVFGAIPPGEPPPPPPQIATDPTPFMLRLRGPAPNEQGQFLLGAPLGGGNHPDRHAWWVLTEMLERAYMEEIRYERGLSYGVSVYTSLFSDAGYFGVYVRTEVGHFALVREIVEAGLARVLAGEIDQADLEAAKTALRGRALLDLQSNLDLAWWHSTDSLITGDDELIPDYFSEIAAVRAADVQRIAHTYLRPDQRFEVIHAPVITPRRARPWAAAGLAAASAALMAWRWRARERD